MLVTKEILALLRKAESIAFFHEGQSNTFVDENGRGAMALWSESHYDKNNNYVHGEVFARLDIQSFVYAYSRNFGSEEQKREKIDAMKATAFESVSKSSLESVLCILKPGDDISLYWTADNNSETLETVNLHADELNLCIHKTDKKGNRKTLKFLLSYRITPYNTSRMIKDRAF